MVKFEKIISLLYLLHRTTHHTYGSGCLMWYPKVVKIPHRDGGCTSDHQTYGSVALDDSDTLARAVVGGRYPKWIVGGRWWW